MRLQNSHRQRLLFRCKSQRPSTQPKLKTHRLLCNGNPLLFNVTCVTKCSTRWRFVPEPIPSTPTNSILVSEYHAYWELAHEQRTLSRIVTECSSEVPFKSTWCSLSSLFGEFFQIPKALPKALKNIEHAVTVVKKQHTK